MQQDSRTNIFGKCIINNRIQEYETKIVRIDNSKVNEWRLERDNAIKGAHFSTSSKSIISMIFMSLKLHLSKNRRYVYLLLALIQLLIDYFLDFLQVIKWHLRE